MATNYRLASLKLCTHKVDFFFQIIHILLGLGLLVFLAPIFRGCRQFVFIFPFLVKEMETKSASDKKKKKTETGKKALELPI